MAVILLLLTGTGSAVGAISNVEREALIALYKNTNGDNWTNKDNWLGPPGTERSWYGVTCKSEGVIGIKLDNNNLVGQIPSELGNLKSLGGLILRNNQLSGSIPPELGNTIIFRLDLHNNQLSGSIPPLTLTALLDLRQNKLSGSIPPELLGKLTTLGNLALSDNQLSGSIPPELGKLKNWKMIHLNSTIMRYIRMTLRYGIFSTPSRKAMTGRRPRLLPLQM